MIPKLRALPPLLVVALAHALSAPAAAQEGAPVQEEDPPAGEEPAQLEDETRDPTQPSETLRAALAVPDPQEVRRSTANVQAPPPYLIEVIGTPERIERVHCERAPLPLLARELVRKTGWNVVVSSGAARRNVDLYVEDLPVVQLVKLIAEAYGLIVRYEVDSRVLRLFDPAEYSVDLDSLRKETTEVHMLLYPNATDVASAVANLYGPRVVVSYGDEGRETLTELEQRFSRFDLLDARGQGLGGTFGGGTSVQGRNFSSGGFSQLNGSGQRRIGGTNTRLQDDLARRDQALLDELTAAQLQALEDEAAANEAGESSSARRLANVGTPIYVTVLRRLNRIVVRTSDEEALEDIAGLVRNLDVPTPLVLLEVKVLRIELGDDLSVGVDLAFADGDGSGSFTTGEILPPAGGSLLPGGAGFDPTSALFQVVSDNFAARIEALQREGRVTALATPLILTANSEVSRIFSGQRVPITVGFTEPQVVVGDGATTTLQAVPITELTDVGTQLLLTANINADRTVTLRLLQESSSIEEDGATILVPVGNGIVEQEIDVLQTQTSSGTIVGQDGELMIFGGLIEELDADLRVQVPLLGDIPLIGFLFKRQEVTTARSELIVTIRPRVLATPADGQRMSQELLKELSAHPAATDVDMSALDTFTGEDVLQPGEARRSLRRVLNFHTLRGGGGENANQN